MVTTLADGNTQFSVKFLKDQIWFTPAHHITLMKNEIMNSITSDFYSVNILSAAVSILINSLFNILM